MTNKEAERIKFETSVLQVLALVTVGVGGGSAGILLGELTMLRVVLAVLGFLVTIILTGAMWRLHRYILTLIEQIPD